MNERIRELLEQAGVKYVTMPKDTIYEKFAELIVRDCNIIVEQNHYKQLGWRTTQKIREHFGMYEEE